MQFVLDFSVPPDDVRVTSPIGGIRAPFISGSHGSAMGALQAAGRVRRQCDRLLAMYDAHLDLTDAEMEELTGIDRSTVIPRRRELIKIGRVHATGHRKNLRTGISNATYGVTR